MSAKTSQNPRLVAATAEKLRDLILDSPREAYLGSMNDMVEQLGVGIVTVQQATRILEYEGLLNVKRGPGGGYYGARPDSATLERTFATYMRVHEIGYREAFEMTVSLDCDIAEATAISSDDTLEESIENLMAQLDSCETPENCIQFEVDFRDTLFRIVRKPLLELMARVAMQLYNAKAGFGQADLNFINLADWKQGRRRILSAILSRDGELAYFEAHRFRRMVKQWMH